MLGSHCFANKGEIQFKKHLRFPTFEVNNPGLMRIPTRWIDACYEKFGVKFSGKMESSYFCNHHNCTVSMNGGIGVESGFLV